MDKMFEVQKSIRDNSKTLQTYLTDLQSWEAEMKRKEAALTGAFEQDLPPVRSKVKKEKPVLAPKKPEKRIASYDYKAWDKFDVDKACEEVDMAEVGPPSLDSKRSQTDKTDKFREEAQYEKERGNTFVKQEKWDEAIACYNRAIDLVKDDAIYYANRGLCYLKKDSLHQAETDCSEALRLDPTYVKALQRRASARERLGSLRAASQDLAEVLKLEPHNATARKQLDAIKTRMGTKGSKSKSSPSSTPLHDSKPLVTNDAKTGKTPKIVELPDEPTAKMGTAAPVSNWKLGLGENVTVIKTVKKPPHLRSKRALKSVPILEIPLGKTEPERPPTRLKIIEIEDDLAQGDSNNNDSNKIEEILPEKEAKMEESAKLISDAAQKEKDLVPEVKVEDLVAPTTSVQFMSAWKYLKGRGEARSEYLNIITPDRIPVIFNNALESDVLSELLTILHEHTTKFSGRVAEYLRYLCRVKRFSALAMFLSTKDKLILNNLLNHCKTVENCSENDIADLKNKYEL